jgi:hypothetical protein
MIEAELVLPPAIKLLWTTLRLSSVFISRSVDPDEYAIHCADATIKIRGRLELKLPSNLILLAVFPWELYIQKVAPVDCFDDQPCALGYVRSSKCQMSS